MQPRDNLVIPFQIEGLGIRGRIVRLGTLATDILLRHNHPEPVSLLLAEALTLTALLGTALKFDGKFTLQTSGDGPISMIVADYETPGSMRAYAHMDRERVASLIEQGRTGPLDLMGKGYLAMTIDQGPDMDRYQGIVELKPGGLIESAHEYFASSEQIATSIRLAVGPIYQRKEDGRSEASWRTGAIMIQHVAREGGLVGFREADDQRPPTDEEENWRRAELLLATVEDHELLDPDLAPERLLYRLYHEDGVRAFPSTSLKFKCRCSHDRMESILKSFPREDIEDMVQDGVITATCEFCNQVYILAPEDILAGGRKTSGDLKE